MNHIITFLKNWTLPSAIVTGTVLYLVFAYVPALDGAARFFDPIFDAIFPLFMAMILFVTFCRIDFHRMRPTAWHGWITLLQLALVALVAGIILSFDMTGNDRVLMESILTCIIAPGAAAAAVVTAKLGGDLETMTTYTFVSNFVTALMVPLVFPMIDQWMEEDGYDILFLATEDRDVYQTMLARYGRKLRAISQERFTFTIIHHSWIPFRS